ncbi:MAG: hypothetical protein NZM37_02960 [Sandaracinaceae bacterium]|nr:hypothetical protein [Sandaracinaceae bacterium]MDW8245708.1 hypothetical protein [Sandaracinaceae bacterium]
MRSKSKEIVNVNRFVFFTFLVLTGAKSYAQNVSASREEGRAEKDCANGVDDDGDGLSDCADADCFEAPRCHAGGSEENSERACSDWVDNDGDGAVDCDDQDCMVPHIRACRGSWKGPRNGSAGASAGDGEELPEDVGSVEELIGRLGDVDGERSDQACSDGVDNDGDGRIDCADFGCRFDPEVTVCQAQPGMRFSVVGGVGGSIQWNYDRNGNYVSNIPEARFTLLQLRALGPIPFIQNSFFLVQARADEQLRVNFVLFQVPVGNSGHYFNVNSGSALLTANFVMSAANYPLLTPPFYLGNIAEPGNGFAVELGGPVGDTLSIARFRLFGAAGSGQGTGNVGGRFFRNEDRNFSWSAGAQMFFDIAGRIDRFDTLFVYTPNPLGLQFSIGGRYDQRPNERGILWQAGFFFRYWHFLLRGDYFGRYVLDYNAINTTFNVSLSVLIIPKVLMIAGDFGGLYRLASYQGLPPGRRTPEGVSYQPEQTTWRVGVSWFFWRRTGVATMVYTENHREWDPGNPLRYPIERILQLEARFRF